MSTMFVFDVHSVFTPLRVLILVVTYSAAGTTQFQPKCTSTDNCQIQNSWSTVGNLIYNINGLSSILRIHYDVQDKSFLMYCNNNEKLGVALAADDPALPIMPSVTHVKKVELIGCLVPKNSYRDALAMLNIKFYSDNGVLHLRDLPASPQLEGYHLDGLDLHVKELLISPEKDITHPKADFLVNLTHLESLSLINGIQPEKKMTAYLPTSLVKLSLLETRLLFGNDNSWLTKLQSLKYLFLEEADADPSAGLIVLPPLVTLPQLREVKLRHLPLEPLTINTTWLKRSNLENLIIEYCRFNQLPNTLFEGANITRIFLGHNALENLNNAFDPLQSSLIELNLASNKLNSAKDVQALSVLEKLDTLTIAHNPLKSLCGGMGKIRGFISSNLPRSLRRLNLKNTTATVICTDWLEKLTHINLENNRIKNLRYSDLQMWRHGDEPVLLNLKNNELRINKITKNNYQECINASKISNVSKNYLRRIPVRLQLDSFDCDCNAYWLREMLLHCPLLQPDDVSCRTAPKHHVPLLDPQRSLTCPYDGPFCPDECTCEKRPSDNATVVRCSSALRRAPSSWPPTAPGYPLALHVAPGTLDHVPRVASLVELHAPNNNITVLNDKDLPSTLRVFDVRNNSIERITSAAAKRLQYLSNNMALEVSLAGNPLACECEDQEAIATLRYAKISDWNTTQCANEELIIVKTTFCPNIMLPTLLGVTGVLLMLTLAALTLLCLRPRIKQFLFDHNWCLQYVLNVKDDIPDPKKTHNVFISYSNYDEAYALFLMRILEQHGHRVIIHSYYFTIGENIMQNVIDSVLSARRTLVVVSDNFANSIWGKEEFRTAHAHALERGSSRVIVIRYKLSDINKLPKDLQNYISLNTYLDWNDRDFWKKLLRVMPPPQDNLQSKIARSKDNRKQLIFQTQLAAQADVDYGQFLSHQSLDRDTSIPVSKMMLLPPLQNKHFPQDQSRNSSPVIPVDREPPQHDNNDPCFSSDMKSQQLTTLYMPSVIYA